jgi:hypothetical protein
MQPIQNASTNDYWAAAPSDEIGDVLQGRVDDYYAYLTSSSLVDLWRKSFYAYYGMLPAASTTGFGLFAVGSIIAKGFEGEIAGLKVNQIRNLITHLVVLTTQSRPAMKCRAVNSDSASLAQAYLGDGILDFYLREKKIEIDLKSSVEMALVFGEAFMRLDWNATAGKAYGKGPNGAPVYNGDIVVKAYNPFDVIRDTSRTAASGHAWYICHDTAVSYDLAAKYPHLASEILSSTSDISTARRFIDPTKVIPAAGVGSKQSDLLDVYEFIHEPTPALPTGRYTVMLQGGLTLFDGPLPFSKSPISRISASDIIGCPFGWTIAFDLLGVQEAIDKLYTIVLSNQLSSGVQNFWQPPGNGLNKTQLGGGLNLLESAIKPEVLELCKTPAEIFNFISKLEQVMETLSGVSAVNRGEAPENLKSGSALAFVASQAVTFSSGLQASYNMLIESVGTMIIEILKDFASTPRMAVIAGSFNRPLMKEFIGKDLAQIDRVVVDATSPMSKTTAGKIQIAQDLLQSGLIRNAREYITVVNTGELDPLYESEISENISVRAENEDLRAGKPVIALVIDDHPFHILEHRSILNNPDSRRDPVLVQNVLNHIQEHVDMDLQLQQQNPALLAIIKSPPLPGPQQPPQLQAPQPQVQPGGPVQAQIAAVNPTQKAAEGVHPARMPSLPAGADQQSQESYAQLKAANG